MAGNHDNHFNGAVVPPWHDYCGRSLFRNPAIFDGSRVGRLTVWSIFGFRTRS